MLARIDQLNAQTRMDVAAREARLAKAPEPRMLYGVSHNTWISIAAVGILIGAVGFGKIEPLLDKAARMICFPVAEFANGQGAPR